MDVQNELYHMTELRKMDVRNANIGMFETKINSVQNRLGYSGR